MEKQLMTDIIIICIVIIFFEKVLLGSSRSRSRFILFEFTKTINAYEYSNEPYNICQIEFTVLNIVIYSTSKSLINPNFKQRD